jgi:hypothetical protein
MNVDPRWLEEAARIRSAQPPGSDLKDQRNDWKWQLGDYLLDNVPGSVLDAFADAANMNKANVRSYAFTARQWPREKRRAATSWTTHRDLAKAANRYEIIRDGMGVREAYELLHGGRKIDEKADQNKSVAERAEKVEQLLSDPAVRAEVARIERESVATRKAKKVARQAEEHDARRIRDAHREAREAERAQHPEAAFIKMHADLLEWEAKLRAILQIAEEELAVRDLGARPLVPGHRRDAFIRLLRTLGDVAYDGADALEKYTAATVHDEDVIDVESRDRSRLARLLASNE